MPTAAPPDLLSFTPVPRQRMRRGGWSADRQRQFIALLAETGSVRAACRRLGVGEHHIYKLRNHPEAASFRAAWEAALDCGIARIEDTLMDRALHGVETPIFYHGEKVGSKQVYNDRLLMFILTNRAPQRYAAGGAPRGFNAVDQQKLDKLKKQWRKEWQAEQGNVTPEEIRASIDRKVAELRRRFQREAEHRWAALSEETREAWAHFLSLRDRDLAAMQADAKTREVLDVEWTAPSTHFDPPAPKALPAPKREAEEAEPPRHPPEGYSHRKPKPPPPPRTTWKLMDDDFGKP